MSSNFFNKIIGSDPHSLLEKAVQFSPLDKGQKIIAKILVRTDKISSEKPAETIDTNELASLESEQLASLQEIKMKMLEDGSIDNAEVLDLANNYTEGVYSDLRNVPATETEAFLDNLPEATEEVVTQRFAIIENFGEKLEAVWDNAEAVEIGDAAEAAAGGALGAGVSYAMYQALKEFLSLEGARRRGEISNKEVVEKVAQIAWEAGKKGAAVGAIFGIAVMIFGGWILVPLTIIAPFAGIKMTMSLWQAFWKGLDDNQRQELMDKANEVGGEIGKFFNELSFKGS